MKLLLDTHALVWWWTDDARLARGARAAIASPDSVVLVSAVTGWELATRHRLGKWDAVATLLDQFARLMRLSRFAPLPVTLQHALAAGGLPGDHRDPFDRMLIAQARIEAAAVVTADPVFARYDATVVWD